MKNRLLILAAAVAALALASCGGFMGVDVTDQGAVDKHLRKNIEKFVDPEAVVFEIMMMPVSQDLTATMSNADVAHMAPGGEELLHYSIMLGGIDKNEPKKSRRPVTNLRKCTADDGVKLKDVDFSGIAANIEAATELMNELGYKVDGVGHYYIGLDSDPAKITHRFELQSFAGNEYKKQGGRRIKEMHYNKATFVADSEGNVTMQ